MTLQEQPGNLFRRLPQVGELLADSRFVGLQQAYSRPLLISHVRAALQQLRAEVREGRHTESSLAAELDQLGENVARRLQQATRRSLRRVINATGVILQTNLGRAPLSAAAIAQIAETAAGYCNLEFDLEAGERSHRDAHVEKLLLDVVEARSRLPRQGLRPRAAAVVNNCAAACFLALNTLAEGAEVLVSRGELVEIGGGFRVPDILRKSGAVLREVGTTNRTRLADYQSALTPATRLILRVHRSNFRMEGFTERPTLDELCELGDRASVPVFEDQGTGCAVDLPTYGIGGESSWIGTLATGPALVACSGDKLFGGPQCGILVGDETLVSKIRSNPLFRVMRMDKLGYAALQATLLAYLNGMEDTVPAIAMLQASASEIRKRCGAIAEVLRSPELSVEVIETQSMIGGGTTPGASIPSFGLSLRHQSATEHVLAACLRGLDPPVITRTHGGSVLLDLRTVFARDDETLTRLLQDAVETLADATRGRPGDEV